MKISSFKYYSKVVPNKLEPRISQTSFKISVTEKNHFKQPILSIGEFKTHNTVMIRYGMLFSKLAHRKLVISSSRKRDHVIKARKFKGQKKFFLTQ